VKGVGRYIEKVKRIVERKEESFKRNKLTYQTQPYFKKK